MSEDADSRKKSSTKPSGEGTYAWGLVFIALALIANFIFDSPPGEYLGLPFALIALVLAVIHIARTARSRRR